MERAGHDPVWPRLEILQMEVEESSRDTVEAGDLPPELGGSAAPCEDLYGALQTYQHIERLNPGLFNVLVVGPWFHGGWSAVDGDWLGEAYFGQKTGDYFRKNMQLQFFNHFLMQIDLGFKFLFGIKKRQGVIVSFG